MPTEAKPNVGGGQPPISEPKILVRLSKLESFGTFAVKSTIEIMQFS